MAAREGMVACPLCNAPVRLDRDGCRSGCPVARKCKILCCPSCGYEFVVESAIVSGVERLVRWLRRGR